MNPSKITNPTYQQFVEKNLAVNMTYLCIDNQFNEKLWNDFGNADSSFPMIQFLKCDRNKTKCADDLDQVTNNIYLSITLLNTYVDSSDYESPIKYFTDTFTMQGSNSFSKRMFLSIKNNLFKSDNGWMLEDYSYTNYMNAVIKKSDINPNNGEKSKGEIFNITIDSPRMRSVNIRNYMKVQELIAKVGGLIKGILISVNIFFNHFLRFEYIIYIFKIGTPKDSQISKYKHDSTAKFIRNDKSNIKSISLGINDMKKEQAETSNAKIINILRTRSMLCLK